MAEKKSGKTLSEFISELKDMLHGELKKRIDKDISRTETRIQKYHIALGILFDFVKEKNFKAFILTFKEYDINHKSIRACFIHSPENKEMASFLFKKICQRVVDVLNKSSLSLRVGDIQFDRKQSPIEFFSAQAS